MTRLVQSPVTIDRELFGQLIPVVRGKLYRRYSVSLRKDEYSYSLGTSKDCDVTIRGYPFAEAYHCTIHFDGDSGAVRIIDRSVVSGVWVNGIRLRPSERHTLQDEDKIQLGFLPSARTYVFRSHVPEGSQVQQAYVIDWSQPLGSGSYGVVWKARKRYSYGIHASRQAIKVLYCETDDTERRHGIMNEIHIHSILRHPNICAFREVIHEPQFDKIYLVIEFLAGGTLEDFVQRFGRPGLGGAVSKDLTRQICSAVSYMHSRSIIHRDLKPANILLESLPVPGRSPQVKIADFGLAKVVLNSMQPRTVCGTPEFVAPEVLSRQYSEAVDAWSIGAIVVFMLTSSSPFVWLNGQRLNPWKNLGDRIVDLAVIDGLVDYGTECASFVGSLLEVRPRERMRVVDSLGHLWLARGD